MEWAIGLAAFLIIMGFGSYLFLMIFFPEWVGITGPSAKKTIAEHQKGSQVDDSDFFDSKKQ
ncbi:MAG: hypothetical protein AB7N80_10495 [Bdellovibrionales bacterium]